MGVWSTLSKQGATTMKFLVGYFDSAWRGDKVDKKSTSGYIFKFLSEPISWCSKKQPTIAFSTCETKYVAGSFATCLALWLKSLLKKLIIDLKKHM